MGDSCGAEDLPPQFLTSLKPSIYSYVVVTYVHVVVVELCRKSGPVPCHKVFIFFKSNFFCRLCSKDGLVYICFIGSAFSLCMASVNTITSWVGGIGKELTPTDYERRLKETMTKTKIDKIDKTAMSKGSWPSQLGHYKSNPF